MENLEKIEPVFGFFKQSRKVYGCDYLGEKPTITIYKPNNTQESTAGIRFEIKGEKGFNFWLDELWIQAVKREIKKHIPPNPYNTIGNEFAKKVDFFRTDRIKKLNLNTKNHLQKDEKFEEPFQGATQIAEKLLDLRFSVSYSEFLEKNEDERKSMIVFLSEKLY